MASRQIARYIQDEFGWMKGKTIAKVRPLSDKEISEMYWHAGYGEVPIIVEFTDGSGFIPSQDAEGNGAGFLISLPL